jgi:hypothetical protein
MFLAPFFQSFEPLQNPLGFGAADYIELLVTAALALLALAARAFLEPYARSLAEKTAWCMALLAALPVLLRLALLPHHPVPTPGVYDEFGHLLVADTLRHFRLANPAHPMRPFFETFFVLQEPTYSSIYPIGQGLALAFGWTVFGLPWAGVVFCTAAFCSLCYWMLRAWTTPLWALAGGLLAVFEFGPLNEWMNNYWGGALAAAGGCLVFGAAPRLRRDGLRKDAILLGAGLAINLVTRPYESIFLVVSLILFFLPAARRPGELRRLMKAAPAVVLVVIPAIGVTLLQNRRVTGSWTTLPYQLSQYQYGVPSALTFQQNPTPHRDLTPEQAMDYKMQSSFRGEKTETVGSYLSRLEYRVRFYRFFFLVPLYLALPFFLAALGDSRLLWAALTVLLFVLGINFFPAFQFHYLAAVTCLFVLIAVAGLRRMSRIGAPGREAALLILLLCAAHFMFWYGVHLFDDAAFSLALRPYETWDGINHRNPERRIDVNRQLDRIPGKLLVLVRYLPGHIFQDEWVYNRADIDASRVVWARDLGAVEDEKLLRYYSGRSVWLLEPDLQPPRLTRYAP